MGFKIHFHRPPVKTPGQVLVCSKHTRVGSFLVMDGARSKHTRVGSLLLMNGPTNKKRSSFRQIAIPSRITSEHGNNAVAIENSDFRVSSLPSFWKNYPRRVKCLLHLWTPSWCPPRVSGRRPVDSGGAGIRARVAPARSAAARSVGRRPPFFNRRRPCGVSAVVPAASVSPILSPLQLLVLSFFERRSADSGPNQLRRKTNEKNASWNIFSWP